MPPTHRAGVRQGDVLLGKYRIDRVLGAGGMGVVVAAHHVDLDEIVAIKFLLPEVLDHHDAVVRFVREARATVKIKSEHVVRVTDVGKLENGAPYMVMEYLEGSDLAAWLREQGRMPVDQAVEFLLQACEAIAEAHSVGIVHRDLKPGNLFVVRRPDGFLSVKVLDFGISKLVNAPGTTGVASMTQTAALMGSPLYMSPEQMQSSKDVDSRSDIWALGVILHELIAGVPPFTAETMPELVLRVVQGEPTPLRRERPDAPVGIETVILRCLAKDRTQRFEHVGELAFALLPYAPRRSKISVERISGVLRVMGFPGTATALPPSSGTEERVDAAGTKASWGKTAAQKPRASWLFAALALLTAGGGAIAFRALSGAPDGAAEASASTAPPALSPVAAAVTAAAEPRPPAVASTVNVVSPASAVVPTSIPSAATARADAAPKTPAPMKQVAARSAPSARPAARASASKVDIFDERK